MIVGRCRRGWSKSGKSGRCRRRLRRRKSWSAVSAGEMQRENGTYMALGAELAPSVMIEPSPNQGDLLLALSSKPGLTTTWVSTQAGASVVVVVSATAVEVLSSKAVEVVSTRAVVAVVAKVVTVVSEAIVEEASATLVTVVGRQGLASAPRIASVTAKIE